MNFLCYKENILKMSLWALNSQHLGVNSRNTIEKGRKGVWAFWPP